MDALKLINPTDQELNTAFAEKVCGITGVTNKIPWDKCAVPVGQLFGTGQQGICVVPDYCSDANAILPWLEKHSWTARSHGMTGSTNGYPHCEIKVVEIPMKEFPERFGLEHKAANFEGDSIVWSFAKSAVIALLRAHGVEIEFTT